MFNVQQEDIDILFQSHQNLYVKIELLNQNLQCINEIQGEIIQGDFSKNAESSARCNGSMSIYVKDSNYLPIEGSHVWLDRLIRIYVGIYHLRSQEVRWYPLGIFLFTDLSYTFDGSTNLLSISFSDMMCLLTGERNGVLGSLTTEIPAGSNIRESMISTITQLGLVDKYLIDEIGGGHGSEVDVASNQEYTSVPYDLKFSAGSSVYQVVEELRDLYPGWETFFDEQGVFICQKIPTCYGDPVVLDESIINPLVISEARNDDYTLVRNVTEVWGKCIEADRYTDSCTNNGKEYSITLDSYELASNDKIGFKANVNNQASPTLKINSETAYPIVDDSGNPLSPDIMQANKSYVFRFKSNKFYLLGQFQIHAITKEVMVEPSQEEKKQDQEKYNCDNISYVVNPESPFCVENIGEVKQVFSDGEYAKIYSNDLAMQRADYENWKATRLQDSITLEMVLIPWLGVNQKISYTSYITNQTEEYIIKSINASFSSGTMTVQAIKFYPLYPDIV